MQSDPILTVRVNGGSRPKDGSSEKVNKIIFRRKNRKKEHMRQTFLTVEWQKYLPYFIQYNVHTSIVRT